VVVVFLVPWTLLFLRLQSTPPFAFCAEGPVHAEASRQGAKVYLSGLSARAIVNGIVVTRVKRKSCSRDRTRRRSPSRLGKPSTLSPLLLTPRPAIGKDLPP
jgi:hypothetical protein